MRQTRRGFLRTSATPGTGEPDGAATFATDDGGWVPTCNSEENGQGGGASAIRFDGDGEVADEELDPALLDAGVRRARIAAFLTARAATGDVVCLQEVHGDDVLLRPSRTGGQTPCPLSAGGCRSSAVCREDFVRDRGPDPMSPLTGGAAAG